MDMTSEISNLNARFEDHARIAKSLERISQNIIDFNARMGFCLTRLEENLQPASEKMRFDEAGVARERTYVDLENEYKALPENYLYYEEDGETSLQLQEDDQDWKVSEGTLEVEESIDFKNGLIGGSTEQG